MRKGWKETKKSPRLAHLKKTLMDPLYCYNSPGICVYFWVFNICFDPTKVSFNWICSLCLFLMSQWNTFHFNESECILKSNYSTRKFLYMWYWLVEIVFWKKSSLRMASMYLEILFSLLHVCALSRSSGNRDLDWTGGLNWFETGFTEWSKKVFFRRQRFESKFIDIKFGSTLSTKNIN